MRLPNIVLLGTGGTIASTANSATALTDYAVTQGVETLLTAVPEIATLANIRCRQVLNVESHEITTKMLLKLARLINIELAHPSVDGMVVTHGTDTLEETAYFLNLTVKSNKPVVIVGAMRPGSALSADGPLNLYNAVLLAGEMQAAGHGVLVMLNDKIGSARFISKCSTTPVDAFRAYDQGYIGEVHNGKVHIFQTPAIRHTTQTDFDMAGVKSLPSVDIIYDHQNAGVHFYEASIKAGRASRVGSGIVSASNVDSRMGLIASGSLNPQKARILLMLALHESSDRETIQACFDRY
jgi:L-asparaginase